MTTQRDSFLVDVQTLRSELARLLEGIDYCFDWKLNFEEWSAREIIYHMVDTPAEGIHTAIQEILDGTIQELPVIANLTNLTQERQANDLDKVREDLEAVLSGMESTLASTTDAELAERKVINHSITRAVKDERSAQDLVAGLFLRHWREHLRQLATLRQTLGLD